MQNVIIISNLFSSDKVLLLGIPGTPPLSPNISSRVVDLVRVMNRYVPVQSPGNLPGVCTLRAFCAYRYIELYFTTTTLSALNDPMTTEAEK